MARKSKKAMLESAVSELNMDVTDATDFMFSEFEDKWEKAEKYYRGESDLPTTPGRSNVIKTEVRDAVRNALPSIMRTLLQARKIVEYIPNSVSSAAWAEQQSEFVTQRFWMSGGYRHLYNAVLDSCKLKIGPVEVQWVEKPMPRYFKYTQVTQDFVDSLIADPDVVIDEIESETSPTDGVVLYEIEGYEEPTNGSIQFQSFPPSEFFISRNSTGIEDAKMNGVHGRRRTVTVAEAIEMDLEYDNWQELDEVDSEQSANTGSSAKRRGYQKRDDTSEVDPLNHKFTLTVVYKRYMLDKQRGTRLYRFWLGGSKNVYLDHEEVDDSPIELVEVIPIPHAPIGNSLADITIPVQDTNTSLIRAILDNAHSANNPRVAANPNKTNFDDLSNQTIGAPIRNHSGEAIQIVSIPFTGAGLLPLMQYLDLDTQNKTGMTKASQGLDPDALQSTDKNAVMNTIQTSQGQTELMVRNIVECALIPLFRKMLRLSIQHLPAKQIMRTKGKLIPVNLGMFDPDLMAVPNVGLGTASPMQKRAALSNVYALQQGYMDKFGMNNPFTSYTKMYNTLEDLLELDGLYDVSRYFDVVTPQVEKKLAQAQAQSAEQQRKEGPVDPIKGMLAIEEVKKQAKMQDIMSQHVLKERELALDALKAQDDNDIKRDKLAQDRIIALAKLGQQAENERIKQEQAANDDARNNAASDTGGATEGTRKAGT